MPTPTSDAFATSGSSPGERPPTLRPAGPPSTDPRPTDPPRLTSVSCATTSRGPGLQTLAVRGGRQPSPDASALLPGICQSTTFAQRAVGDHDGSTYSRCGNPTVDALESALAAFEGTRPSHSIAYGTGMAALVGLVLAHTARAERVVLSRTVYGGTVRLVRELLERFGVVAHFVDTTDLDGTRDADGTLDPKRLAETHLGRALADTSVPTRLVLIESPANPTLELTDIEAAAHLAHGAGARLAVDNTFLTATLQPVLALGADVAVLSTTKYVEGHNATTGGALLVADRSPAHAELARALRHERGVLGSIQKPFEAWLTLQGLKTLPLRLHQHGRNALRVARFLEQLPAIGRVRHPFLESFEQSGLARRQQSGGGGIISFELAAHLFRSPAERSEAARRLLASTRLCTLAENLGATETLVTHPATMTHASYAAAERERLGITDGLIRLSVGLEDPVDVEHDLARAIDLALGSLAEEREDTERGGAQRVAPATEVQA